MRRESRHAERVQVGAVRETENKAAGASRGQAATENKLWRPRAVRIEAVGAEARPATPRSGRRARSGAEKTHRVGSSGSKERSSDRRGSTTAADHRLAHLRRGAADSGGLRHVNRRRGERRGRGEQRQGHRIGFLEEMKEPLDASVVQSSPRAKGMSERGRGGKRGAGLRGRGLVRTAPTPARIKTKRLSWLCALRPALAERTRTATGL